MASNLLRGGDESAFAGGAGNYVSTSFLRSNPGDVLEDVIAEKRLVVLTTGDVRMNTARPVAAIVPWDVWQAIQKSSELEAILRRLDLKAAP